MALDYALFVVAGLVALGIAAAVIVVRRRAPGAPIAFDRDEPLRSEPINVRILHTPGEVEEALERAMAQEKFVMREAGRRFRAYRRVLAKVTTKPEADRQALRRVS